MPDAEPERSDTGEEPAEEVGEELGEELEEELELPLRPEDFSGEVASELVDMFASDPSVARRLIYAAGFSGPLPPPSILAAYEEIIPGSADRIIFMAEAEQSHRHGVMNRLSKTEAFLGPFGMVAGLIVSLAFLLVAAWLIQDGHEEAGVLLGSVDLVALVTVFVIGRRRS